MVLYSSNILCFVYELIWYSCHKKFPNKIKTTQTLKILVLLMASGFKQFLLVELRNTFRKICMNL